MKATASFKVPACAVAALVCLPSIASAQSPTFFRVATFNTSLNRNEMGRLEKDLSDKNNEQAKSIAEIIQQVRPELLLLNEFDYDPDGNSIRLFQKNYLAVSQNGRKPIHFSHFTAAVNTGEPSGCDFDNNGSTTDPADSYGFGRFPGQYGMAVLSMYLIDRENVRTFRKLRWNQMPYAKVPVDPATNRPFYSKSARDVFRLSSKSHWDIPILWSSRGPLHFLVCHPTPPAFDGPERRNRLRNHDEIRLFSDYLSPDRCGYIVDDAGRRGGLPPGELFVIAGDLNADPHDGSSENHAVRQLLNHPRIRDKRTCSTKAIRQRTPPTSATRRPAICESTMSFPHPT